MPRARLVGTTLIALSIATLAASLPQRVAAGDRAFPSFETVTKVVLDEFKNRKDFRRGDLISLGDVEPIFDRLSQLGWPPSDVESVYDAFLHDDSLLVRELETDAGRQFMRKVSKFPGVYDRLDRLTWLADGQHILHRMIRDPQGVEQLRLMTMPAGMEEVQERIAKDPRGANFSLPSGRIHTVDGLLKALQEAHTTALAQRQD